MQQMKTWGVMARSLMAFLLVVFLAVGVAVAQTGQAIRFEIPHEFMVGSKVLPAGKYTFAVDNFGLSVKSASNGTIHTNMTLALAAPRNFSGMVLSYLIKPRAVAFSPKSGCPGATDYSCTALRQTTIARS